jgi:hypothetical protein
MGEITGADLGTQAWVRRTGNAPPTKEGFTPPPSPIDRPRVKPRGGMWTSTYAGSHGSGWVQWCLSEDYGCTPDSTFPLWTLEPDTAARIYQIDSYADLESLVAAYPHRQEFPDHGFGAWSDVRPRWEHVARDFDAVNLTDEGQWETRLSHPLDLYGWDCESTLWLRWAFVSATDLGLVRCEALDEEEVAT